MDFLDATFSQYRAGTEWAAGSVQEGAMASGRTAETATFPIAGYDDMNVEEISERTDALTDDQIRRLGDYERANQNRKTLMERFESRLRASS